MVMPIPTLVIALDSPEPVRTITTRRQIIAVNTSAVYKLDPPIAPPANIPTSSTVPITIMAAHTLLAGQPIFITPVGTIDKAAANGIASIGLVVTDVYAGAAAVYTSEGSVSRDDWTPITGSYHLIPGAIYYLASTGMLTNIPPTSGLLQQMGIAVSHAMLDVDIRPAVQLVT